MDLSVSLEQHVGEKNDPLVGVQKICHDQFMIMVSSPELKKASGREKLHVGYVGITPGRPINFLPQINRFGTGVAEKISERVCELLEEHTQGLVEELESAGAPESDVAAARDRAEEERATSRTGFIPPSDQLMEAPPADENLLGEAGDDGVEAIT